MTVSGIVPWVPPDWYTPLFVAKGLLGAVAVLLLVFYMNHRWCCVRSRAQKWRFITLMAYAVLTTSSSAEQIAESDQISYRHLAALALSLLLIWTCVQSFREAHHDDCRRNSMQ